MVGGCCCLLVWLAGFCFAFCLFGGVLLSVCLIWFGVLWVFLVGCFFFPPPFHALSELVECLSNLVPAAASVSFMHEKPFMISGLSRLLSSWDFWSVPAQCVGNSLWWHYFALSAGASVCQNDCYSNKYTKPWCSCPLCKLGVRAVNASAFSRAGLKLQTWQHVASWIKMCMPFWMHSMLQTTLQFVINLLTCDEKDQLIKLGEGSKRKDI